MATQIDADYDMTFTIEGDYIPGESDSDVGYEGNGTVENVKVFIGSINITSQLNDYDLDHFKFEFLDYCEEDIGG